MPAGTTVDQIQFFTRQPSNNTAEFVIYVGGTAAANKVGTWQKAERLSIFVASCLDTETLAPRASNKLRKGFVEFALR